MCVTGQIVLAENWYAYKYASMNWFLIDSGNDFSPIQCQAITKPILTYCQWGSEE